MTGSPRAQGPNTHFASIFECVDKLQRREQASCKQQKAKDAEMAALKSTLTKEKEEKLAKLSAAHNKCVAAKDEEMSALRSSLQRDREKELGFKQVTFLMDREKPGASETQVGFFEFVVLPLFSLLVRVFPDARPMLEAVQHNEHRWRAIDDDKAKKARRATA